MDTLESVKIKMQKIKLDELHILQLFVGHRWNILKIIAKNQSTRLHKKVFIQCRRNVTLWKIDGKIKNQYC